MDITVSSPGSPGTSFTDDVKETILTIYDVLEKSANFASFTILCAKVGDDYEKSVNYIRNILAFLKNCGIVRYQRNAEIINKEFFTNIGKTYINILRSIKVIKAEPESKLREEILANLKEYRMKSIFNVLLL